MLDTSKKLNTKIEYNVQIIPFVLLFGDWLWLITCSCVMYFSAVNQTASAIAKTWRKPNEAAVDAPQQEDEVRREARMRKRRFQVLTYIWI